MILDTDMQMHGDENEHFEMFGHLGPDRWVSPVESTIAEKFISASDEPAEFERLLRDKDNEYKALVLMINATHDFLGKRMMHLFTGAEVEIMLDPTTQPKISLQVFKTTIISRIALLSAKLGVHLLDRIALFNMDDTVEFMSTAYIRNILPFLDDHMDFLIEYKNDATGWYDSVEG
jgi:hypothetical protein